MKINNNNNIFKINEEKEEKSSVYKQKNSVQLYRSVSVNRVENQTKNINGII